MNPGANNSSSGGSLQAAWAFAKIVLKSDNVKGRFGLKIYTPLGCIGKMGGAFPILEGVGGQCQEIKMGGGGPNLGGKGLDWIGLDWIGCAN